MLMAMIGAFILFIFALFEYTVSYPWHASCEIKWTVPASCNQVQEKLISQMRAWESDSLCPGVSDTCPSLPCGQKCLYEYGSVNGNVLKGLHKTPAKRYIDDMTFTFKPQESTEQSCRVDAYSTSRTWYAFLDWGTNYCNLRNLLDGTGLSTRNGFSEETSTSDCTQYDSIDCERY